MTSITVSDSVKGDLAQWKPDDVSWTAFLRVLQQSTDPRRFEVHMKRLLEAEEQDSIERARARYTKHRGNAKAGVSATDLLEDLS
jgi:hypothetical protein